MVFVELNETFLDNAQTLIWFKDYLLPLLLFNAYAELSMSNKNVSDDEKTRISGTNSLFSLTFASGFFGL